MINEILISMVGVSRVSELKAKQNHYGDLGVVITNQCLYYV